MAQEVRCGLCFDLRLFYVFCVYIFHTVNCNRVTVAIDKKIVIGGLGTFFDKRFNALPSAGREYIDKPLFSAFSVD